MAETSPGAHSRSQGAGGGAVLAWAHSLYREHRYTDTIEQCRRVLADEPARTDALLLQGAAHFQLRDFEHCIACNEAAVHADPHFAEAYGNLGNALKELGDLDGAVRFYAKAIGLKPRFCDAYNNLAAAYAQLGQVPAAVHSYRTAISINPALHDAHCNLGNLLKHGGQLAEAKACYLESIRLRPSFAIAWSNLAGLVKEMGDVPGAISAYQEAVRLDPAFSDAWSNMGNALKEAGRLADAKAAYNEAIRIRPAFAIAHGNLASCFYDEGDMRSAVDEYALAIRLEPNFPDAYNNLGNAYRELGMVEESVRCYRTALHLKPDHAHAYNNLGNSLKDKGLVKEAIHCYMTACRLMPSFAAAHSNLASILKEQGKLDAAVAHYHAAIRADPSFADAYSNMGNAYKDVGRLGDAIKCYAMAIRLRPAHGDALSNLASAFKDCGRVEEATVCYRRALQLKPSFPDAYSNLVHSLFIVCDWRQRTRLLHGLFGILHQQLRASLPEHAACPVPGTTASDDPSHGARANALFAARTEQEAAAAAVRLPPGTVLGPVLPGPHHIIPGHVLPCVQPFHSLVYPLDAREMRELARCYAARAVLTARAVGQPAFAMPPLARGQRLRVGYVSSDFGNHPLSHLMQSVFGMHDKSRFEVFCFALSPNDGSTWRGKIEAEVEHVEDLTALNFADCARLIHSRGIHVLINLNGYTKGARNELFALRPAPVQVSYMGFCGTMGAECMDYFIVDKTVAPPQLAHHYTETLAYMPHSYFVNDHKQSSRFVLDPSTAPARSAYRLPETGVVFANFNQLYKIDPVTFEAWARILKRVPGSVLWLLRFPPAGELNVRRAARALGLTDDRIVFTDVAPKDEHISRGRLADIFLDTPMCNAHTTACDILWSGVPIVTVPGEKMACRVAASLLCAAGLRECIASSLAEYEEKAVTLALDGPRRAAMRSRLEASRDSLPAFDTVRWTRNLEGIYAEMWGQYTTGRKHAITVRDCLDGSLPEPYTAVHFSRTPDEAVAFASSAASVASSSSSSVVGAAAAADSRPELGSMQMYTRRGGSLPAEHVEARIERYVAEHPDVRERSADEVAYNALIQPAPPLPPGPAAAVTPGAQTLPPPPIPAIGPPPGLVITPTGVALPVNVATALAAAAGASHLLAHGGHMAARRAGAASLSGAAAAAKMPPTTLEFLRHAASLPDVPRATDPAAAAAAAANAVALSSKAVASATGELLLPPSLPSAVTPGSVPGAPPALLHRHSSSSGAAAASAHGDAFDAAALAGAGGSGAQG